MENNNSLANIIERSIKNLAPHGIVFKADDKRRVSLKSCLEVILSNINTLKENDGYEEWEWYKDKFKDKLEVSILSHMDHKAADWEEVVDLCLVFIFEINYIVNDKSLEDLLDKLLGVRQVFKNRNAQPRLNDTFDKYASGVKKNLELYRKAQASESMINYEINKRLGIYKEREAELNKSLSELKKDFSTLKGDTSFLSSSKVFSKLEKNARIKDFAIFFSVFLFAMLTVSFLFIVAFQLINTPEEGLFRAVASLEGIQPQEAVMFWEEVRLIDVKLFAISSTFVFLSIYFFRVFLSLHQKSTKRLNELEFKAAIASYIEGHVDFVKDKGGNHERSIVKYEDFIFLETPDDEDLSNEPKPTDNLKDVGDVAEKLIKAGRG